MSQFGSCGSETEVSQHAAPECGFGGSAGTHIRRDAEQRLCTFVEIKPNPEKPDCPTFTLVEKFYYIEDRTPACFLVQRNPATGICTPTSTAIPCGPTVRFIGCTEKRTPMDEPCDEDPDPELAISVGGGGETEVAVVAGGKDTAPHTRSGTISASNTKPYTVSLSGTAGVSPGPSPEVTFGDGAKLVLGGSLSRSGSQSFTFRSGNKVGSATFKATSKKSDASFTFQMVPPEFEVPTTACADGTSNGFKLIHASPSGKQQVAEHEIDLSAEPLDPTTGTVVVTPDPLITSASADGDKLTLTYDGPVLRASELTATDNTVFLADGTHPTTTTEVFRNHAPVVVVLPGTATYRCDDPALEFTALVFDEDTLAGKSLTDEWKASGLFLKRSGTFLKTGSSKTFTLNKLVPGSYTVELSVTDSCGVVTKDTVALAVPNLLPTAIIKASVEGSIGAIRTGVCRTIRLRDGTTVDTCDGYLQDALVLDASESEDCENKRDGIPLTYQWSGAATGTGPVLRARLRAGDSTYRLTVTDADGGVRVKELVFHGTVKDPKKGAGPIECRDVSNPPRASNVSGLPGSRVGLTGREQPQLPAANISATGELDTAGCSTCSSCGGGDGGGGDPSCGLVGDPVNLFHGGVVMRAMDMDCGSGDPGLIFQRTYNSILTLPGSLGPGWSHTFERRLRELGDDGAVEVDGRGVELFFPAAVAGTYGPPVRGGAQLVRNEAGWVVTYETGTAYHYRIDGRLDRIVNAHGVATTFTYAVDGSLGRITGRGDRTIEVESSSGLIRSVRTGTGLTARYAYDAAGRLAVVTDVRGHATKYDYEAESGRLRSVTYPSGDAVEYEYDAQGRSVATIARSAPRSGQAARVSRVTIEYFDDGRRKVVDPAGRETLFTYNEAGQLDSRVDPGAGTRWVVGHDAQGRVTDLEHADGKKERWTYSEQGELATYTSTGGRSTSVVRDATTRFPTTLRSPGGSEEHKEFDASGALMKFVNGAGHATTYTRNAFGDLVEVRDAEGRITRHEYAGDGRLTSTTDAAGRVTRYEHDEHGRTTAVITPGGRTTRTDYSGLGLVQATVDAGGHRTTFEHDQAGRTTATVRPNGARTEQIYEWINGASHVVETKDAMGGVSKSVYDDSGRLIKSIDPIGRETVTTLDEEGRVARVTPPDGNFTTYHYQVGTGVLAETRNAHGIPTKYFYDADRRLIRTESVDGSSTSQAYDARGRVRSRTAQDGATEHLVYDGADRVVATIDAMGHISRTEYTKTGAVKKTTDAKDRVTQLEVDELDRTVKVTDALGLFTGQAFGPDGEVTTSTNARGHPTRYVFDASGQLEKTIDALEGVVKQAHDAVGNLASVTDQKGHTWTFEYDLNGRRTKETDPNGRSTYTFYNAAGEVTRVAFPDGSEWRYARDPGGRVTRRDLVKNGVVEDIETFSYDDLLGRRTAAENRAARTESNYNDMDREVKRVSRFKDPKTGVVRAVRELRFVHDARGRRQLMFDSHGRVTMYHYDPLGRPVLIAVGDPNPASTGVADQYFMREYRFTWDATVLLEVRYPNGTRTRREHDKLDRLVKLAHERLDGDRAVDLLASWEISRDPNGNPTKVTRENGEVWTFEHDSLDRLAKAHLPRGLVARLREKDPAKGKSGKGEDEDERDDEDKCEKLLAVSGEVEYRYDAAQNIVEQNFGGRSIRSTFDAANQMLTRGSMRFKYSERGDQTEKIHKSGRREVFGYSAAGKLASYATGHVHRPDRLKEVERYMHSPDGQRAFVEDAQGKKLQLALWDGSRQIEEWTEHGHGAGKKEKGHFYTRDLGGQLLEQARFTRRGGRTAHASEDDDFDEWDGDEDRRGDDGWRHGPRKPKLNHVRFVLEDFLGSAALVTNHRGRVLDRREFAPFGVPLAGNFKKMPFGYTGHRAEAQTGHWSAMHRQLDPRAGRWTQADPAGAIDGLNRYWYVRDRPLVETDSSGLYIDMISKSDPDKLVLTSALTIVAAARPATYFSIALLPMHEVALKLDRTQDTGRFGLTLSGKKEKQDPDPRCTTFVQKHSVFVFMKLKRKSPFQFDRSGIADIWYTAWTLAHEFEHVLGAPDDDKTEADPNGPLATAERDVLRLYGTKGVK